MIEDAFLAKVREAAQNQAKLSSILGIALDEARARGYIEAKEECQKGHLCAREILEKRESYKEHEVFRSHGFLSMDR